MLDSTVEQWNPCGRKLDQHGKWAVAVAAVAEVVVAGNIVAGKHSAVVGADIQVQQHKMADHTYSEGKRTWDTAPTEDRRWRCVKSHPETYDTSVDRYQDKNEAEMLNILSNVSLKVQHWEQLWRRKALDGGGDKTKGKLISSMHRF